jgi:class 3 adenylate cyclase/CheY-like chemotaxis protein
MEANFRKKVLLVDDSDLVAMMVSEAFENAGLTVVRGKNGAEGIELAYSEIPDVIVLDVEMPLMQGYIASRLLKNQRGVRDIPIIMHTSLSEDKDKYWAMASGANEFVSKDFDNMDRLVNKVLSLAESSEPDSAVIREDAARMSRDRVFEMLGSVLDQQLFQSSITNSIGKIGRSMTSLSETSRQLLDLLGRVCDTHIAVLIVRYNRDAMAYELPVSGLDAKDENDFFSICLGDFYEKFPATDISGIQKTVFPAENPADTVSAAQGKKISSYVSFTLFGRGDTAIGTLHVGNRTNEYFSERITSNIEMFVRNAGSVLDNSILYNQTCEMQQKIRSAFSKYVPREIIDDLIDDHQKGELAVGEKRVVTVLFCDMRKFTTISENNSAENVVLFLNRYFNVMVSIIKKHGGTIDKFIGDAILAMFGAPTSYEDNTPRAVRAAREMIDALPGIELNGLVLPPSGLRIGIGIHEGNAIVGNIGSQEKTEYTVIGDTVNLASRLEGLTKYYQEPVLVSETVMEHLNGEFKLREIDSVRVKGKEDGTKLFGFLAPDHAADEEFLDYYAKGLAMYRMGNWSTALGYLEKALARQPGDRCAGLLLERCRRYQVNPPDDWDGTESMDFK